MKAKFILENKRHEEWKKNQALKEERKKIDEEEKKKKLENMIENLSLLRRRNFVDNIFTE